MAERKNVHVCNMYNKQGFIQNLLRVLISIFMQKKKKPDRNMIPRYKEAIHRRHANGQ